MRRPLARSIGILKATRWHVTHGLTMVSRRFLCPDPRRAGALLRAAETLEIAYLEQYTTLDALELAGSGLIADYGLYRPLMNRRIKRRLEGAT
jgi:hypothetical protein